MDQGAKQLLIWKICKNFDILKVIENVDSEKTKIIKFCQIAEIKSFEKIDEKDTSEIINLAKKFF